VKLLYEEILILLRGKKKNIAVLAIALSSYTTSIFAQTTSTAPTIPDDLNPKLPPNNLTEPFKLPSPDLLFAPSPQLPPSPSNDNFESSESIVVKKFEVIGSSVFSEQDLEKVTESYLNRAISIIDLFQARTKITELYLNRGYITSGAYLPEQDLQTGVVKIQIVEGGLDEIQVTGLNRLNSGYIQSRIEIATAKPLNRNRLLEALQLLQINPLIESISANLSPSLQAGLNNLEVKVTESKTFSLPITFDNSRTPSVGSDRRQIQLVEANLTGLGDRLSLSYANTNGSNAFDASYTVPINPHNGTISLNFGNSASNVVEIPFNILDIISSSRNYELSIRQPLLQNTAQEFALGLTLSHRQSTASLLGGAIPFPSLGADADGQTKASFKIMCNGVLKKS
jgi:hemolysin activation/secretion protein